MEVKEQRSKAGLHLNIKKTKIMTAELHNLNVDNEDTETVRDFCLPLFSHHVNGDCSQEIKRRLRLGRAAMKELGKIIKCKEVSLEAKAKIIHTLVFPIAMYKCESWTVKKADRKKIDSFEIWCWRRALWILWTARKVNKWVLEQIKPELLLEAKMIKLRLSYFGHIMRRQDSLEKTIMLGKVEGSRKRGRPNMRWIDSIKEAIGMSLQKLSRTVEYRTLKTSLINRVARSQS